MKKKFKRALGFILVFVCLMCNVAYATDDFSTMEEEELLSLIDAARQELFTRQAEETEELVLIYDKCGVQVYLDKSVAAEINDFMEALYIPIVMVNSNNYNIEFMATDGIAQVNGWQVGCYMGAIAAEARGYGHIIVSTYDARISTIEEIEDIAFEFYLMDENWEDIPDSHSGEIIIVF